MRCVGIDNASTGWRGIALAVDGVPVKAAAWKPKVKIASIPVVIEDGYEWLRWWLRVFKPDVVAVEELQVFLNKKTIRSMSRHEGVALLAAKQSGAVVIHPSPSQSRRVVFAAGNISKDDAWVAFRKMYPDLDLRAKTSGGLDQMDAYTHALAAPVVLERR